MPKFVRRAWSLNSARTRGLTLMELMVTLTIVSILAGLAVPYVEVTVQRSRELELRRALRDVRTAIDRLHDDWIAGRVSKHADGLSEEGYPKTLEALVEGVESAAAKGGRIKYLRRVPRDPFADQTQPPLEQWIVRGYQDETDTKQWNGVDVYDIRSASDKRALDGSRYDSW